MKRQNKIICLAFLFLIAFGGMYIAPMLMSNNMMMPVVERPSDNYVVAASASTLDATAADANNITNGRGVAAALYLLAGAYEEYVIVVNVTDLDGYADIVNISVNFEKAGVSIGGVLYNRTGVTGDIFSELTAAEIEGANADIRMGTCTNISAADVIDLTVPIALEWSLGAQTDLDLNFTCYDGDGKTTRTENLNFDVIATLTMSDTVMFTYNEYLNGASFGTIGLTYHYTGYTTLYPLGAETDFYVSMAAVTAEQIGARIWESTAYADGTGIASFNDILAPDTNTEITLTFTEYAVSQGDGTGGTDLAAATYTDTVVVGPNAPEHTDPGDGGIIPTIFDSLEGTLLVGGVAVVIMTGAYYAYGRSGSSSPRRRTSKRKKTAKKRKRKR